MLWPMAYLLYLSFTSGSFTRAGIQWTGLTNYVRLLSMPYFWQVLQNTAVFTLTTVIPSLALPLALAILLDRKLPLRDVWRTAFILPSFISLVAAGLVEKLWW